MTHTSVVLGGIAFQDFEVPEKIEFGGAQRVIVHELIGGGRVVDALGGQPQEISFSGFLSGATAVARAQALDTVCTAGNIISLGWDNFYYQVIIKEFIVDYHKPWWMPFKICCAVNQDIFATSQNSVTPIANLIVADLGVADTLAAQAGITTQPISSTTVAFNQAQVESRRAMLGGNLTANCMSIADATDGHSGATSMTQLVDLSSSLAAVTAMAGYINRAAYNIGLSNS